MLPIAIAFTRIPLSARVTASDFVSWLTEAAQIEYAKLSGNINLSAIELKLIIRTSISIIFNTFLINHFLGNNLT